MNDHEHEKIFGICCDCKRHINKTKTQCNKCATRVIKDTEYYKQLTSKHYLLFYTYSRTLHFDPTVAYHMKALKNYFQK